MILKFTIEGQNLFGFIPDTVSDSVGYFEVALTASKDWDGLDIWLHAKAPDGAVYDYEIDPETMTGKQKVYLSAGRWEFWFHGNDLTAGVPQIRIVTDTVSTYVEKSLMAKTGPLPTLPISAAEQIAANAAYAIKIAEEALELAGKTGEAAVLAESWAVGGTGTREGEDTNNAKYYAEQAIQDGKTKLDAFTIKSDGIPEIVSPAILRTWFYGKRKETARCWQFEISPGSNENLIAALGGFPGDHTAAEKWFLYIDLPYSEAGGFIIHAQLEGRTNGLLYRQDQWSTLDSKWHGTGWLRIEDVQQHLDDHEANRSNPHGVTAEQTGATTPADVAAAVEKAVKPKADTTYVDTQDEATLSSARAYADRQDEVVLAAAKQYTDGSVPAPYELPKATADTLGGVKAPKALTTDTQAVRAKEDGTLWTAPGGGAGAVESVNGQTGAVVLTAADVGAENWATVAVKEAIPDITDEATFRTYFYDLRKSAQRKYQFEISEGGIHENIVTGVGGRPKGAGLKDKAFIYVDLPYSEAGGYIIRVTYQLRSKPGMWRKEVCGTLDSRWSDSGWYKPTFITTAVITSEAGRYVCDMTASQIIDADRKGVVKAEFSDPVSGELRTYQYAKQTTDRRAVFSKDGYIEDGVPKQTLIYVDSSGNVEVETRSPFVDAAISETSELPVQNKVVKQYVDDSIGALGTVFDYKGSKPTKGDLPPDGNTTGDVWFVVDESVGYIWLESGVWEPFGPAVDLSGYLQKPGAGATGDFLVRGTDGQGVWTTLTNRKDVGA